MSSERLFRWTGHALVEEDAYNEAEYAIDAADSLLVSEGLAFALGLHRTRFMNAVETMTAGRKHLGPVEVDAFWDATCDMIPRRGDWFPRVELRSSTGGTHLVYRQRPAPALTRSVRLVTLEGTDPRLMPAVKGPDIGALVAARATAQARGADDVVILTPQGHIIDAATSALVWWRGDTLCSPPLGDEDSAFARVSSVTAKSILGLATVLGIETRTERAFPADVEGSEVWALNALHGIRIVTGWVDGPNLAEMPGRMKAWRERREALRAPMGDSPQ